MRRRPRTVRVLFSVLGASACAAAGPYAGTAPSQELPPPGFGTLHQDDVTVTLVVGPLQIKVTPLAQSVIRVTAPDTYRRLDGLAEAYAGAAATDPAQRGRDLYLVSLFSVDPGVSFVPEDLQIVSRGLPVRHARIEPVTPGWGERRLRQRETEMAVYTFPGVDLESDVVVRYGDVSAATWGTILPRVRAERARARARAGVGGAASAPTP